MAIQYPIVNGVRHSFTSIEFRATTGENFGQVYFIKSINYERKRSRGTVRGNHPDPLGKTRGENEYTGDLELYLAEWQDFVTEVLGGAGYGDKFFNLVVTYNETGFDPIVDEIVGCTWDASSAQNSQGTDPTVRKVDLNPIKIRFNGIDDLEIPLAATAG